jgi:hypothetical protein
MTTYLDLLPLDLVEEIYKRKHKAEMKEILKEITEFEKTTLNDYRYHIRLPYQFHTHLYNNYRDFYQTSLEQHLYPQSGLFVRFGRIECKVIGCRKCIFIHGKEYCYKKGSLITYLEQNGKKWYKSWTFKKLYDACYSF